jgi:dihydrofolate synthase/folylpolyglutamate synthase
MTALAWLEGLPRFSVVKYNLYRTWLLLSTLVPDFAEFDIYFITGTKGKGTVAASTAAILRAAGISTGLVTSPHLISPRERVNLNGSDISTEELEECLGRVKRGLLPLAGGQGEWIFSEVLLVAALLWFRERGANTVVLEAGLGGRLDPGNVFRRPRATCITSVAREHAGILGETLAEIAAEKAGIVKPKTPLITAAEGEALAVISRRAERFGAPLFRHGVEFQWQDGSPVRLRLPERSLSFQAKPETPATQVNKAMAACMASLDKRVGDEAIIQGILAPGLPGRFEIHPGSPTLVLDVAHTPEAVANLVQGVEKFFPGKRVAYVAGFLADKAAEAMLRGMASGNKVYCAPVQDSRSFDVAGIDIPGVRSAPSIAAAMGEAAAGVDVLCVTGSFSAVREAKAVLSREF